MTWDIFCTVIDNFGDIGVTWRLSRLLAAEHQVRVRLWVDDLAAFQRIRPEVDPNQDCQSLSGVEIRRWTDPLPEITPGDVVIEALACHLPEAYIGRLTGQTPQPVWLNLEYLTAEAWAEGVHGLPSPHPRLALTKYFFVPGFRARTGGLTREAGLLEARTGIQADVRAQAALWQGLGLAPATPGEIRISLFAYENAAISNVLSTLAASGRAMTLLVPESKALPQVAAWLGQERLAIGSAHVRGNLSVHVLPMLDQDAYDRLLWACDLNFVRGEDSFLRAQFAARPMVWQAYRQEERAHFAKLDAFLDLYCADMPPGLAVTIRSLWHAWNEEVDPGHHLPAYLEQLEGLGAHARGWCAHLAKQPDLASKLMIFCEKVRGKS